MRLAHCLLLFLPSALTGCAPVAEPATASATAIADASPTLPATPRGTPNDFDFEHGNWRTQLRRRLHPLSGSDEWAEYTGTTLVHPALDGRANLVELDVTGPAGHIQGLSLRLFEPEAQRWTLNFSNLANGTLVAPMRGGFDGGPRGVFYSAEDFDGRPVLVRFVIEVTGVDSARFEQAFSADGGQTWEVNWMAEDTRQR